MSQNSKNCEQNTSSKKSEAKLENQNSKNGGNNLFYKFRASKKLVLFVVFFALFLDYMLMTIVGMCNPLMIFKEQDSFLSFFVMPVGSNRDMA